MPLATSQHRHRPFWILQNFSDLVVSVSVYGYFDDGCACVTAWMYSYLYECSFIWIALNFVTKSDEFAFKSGYTLDSEYKQTSHDSIQHMLKQIFTGAQNVCFTNQTIGKSVFTIYNCSWNVWLYLSASSLCCRHHLPFTKIFSSDSLVQIEDYLSSR